MSHSIMQRTGPLLIPPPASSPPDPSLPLTPPPLTSSMPFPSCLIQPRSVTFEIGVIGGDLLHIAGEWKDENHESSVASTKENVSAAESVCAQATPAPAPALASSSAESSLSTHPIRSLLTSADDDDDTSSSSASTALPRRLIPPARLEPIYQAMLLECTRRGDGNGPVLLSYGTWMRCARLYFHASAAVARMYWTTFLSVHRSAWTWTPKPDQSGSDGKEAECGDAIIQPALLHTEVDLQEWMIFLLLQRYSRYFATTPVDGSSTSASHSDSQRSFLLQELRELLRWCCDPPSSLTSSTAESAASRPKTASATFPASDGTDSSSSLSFTALPLLASSLTIHAHEFDRMAFLLQGLARPHEKKEVRHLSALAPFWIPPSSTAAPATIADDNNSATPSTTRSSSVPLDHVHHWLHSQLNRPSIALSLSYSSSISCIEDLHDALSDGGPSTTVNNNEAHFSARKLPQLPCLPVMEIHDMRDRTLFLTRNRSSDTNDSNSIEQEQPPPIVSNVTDADFDRSAANIVSNGSHSTSRTMTLTRSIHAGSFIHAHNLRNSAVIIEAASRFAFVENLEKCVLQLGVVSHAAVLRNLRECSIWIAMAPSTASDDDQCHVHAMTSPTNVRLERCKDVRIYMYNASGRMQLIEPNDPDPSSSSSSPPAILSSAPSILGALPSLSDELASMSASSSPSRVNLGHSPSSSFSSISAKQHAQEGNSDVVLAPYNTFYPTLEADLDSVCFKAHSCRSSNPCEHDQRQSCFSRYPPGCLRWEILHPSRLPNSVANNVEHCAESTAKTDALAVVLDEPKVALSPPTPSPSPPSGTGVANSTSPTLPSTSLASTGRRGQVQHALSSRAGSHKRRSGNQSMVQTAGAPPPIFLTFPDLLPSASITNLTAARLLQLCPVVISTGMDTDGLGARSNLTDSDGPNMVETPNHNIIRLLQPEKFFPSTLPSPSATPLRDNAATTSSITRCNPFILPVAYSSALSARQHIAMRSRTLMMDAFQQLSSSQSTVFESSIHMEFLSWLHRTYSRSFVSNVTRMDAAAMNKVTQDALARMKPDEAALYVNTSNPYAMRSPSRHHRTSNSWSKQGTSSPQSLRSPKPNTSSGSPHSPPPYIYPSSMPLPWSPNRSPPSSSSLSSSVAPAPSSCTAASASAPARALSLSSPLSLINSISTLLPDVIGSHATTFNSSTLATSNGNNSSNSATTTVTGVDVPCISESVAKSSARLLSLALESDVQTGSAHS